MNILEQRNNNGRSPAYHHGGIEQSVELGDKTPPAPVARRRDEHIEINRRKWYGAKRPYNQGVIPNGSGPTGLGSSLTPDTLHYLGPRMYFLERAVKAIFIGGCLLGVVGATALLGVLAHTQNGSHIVANVVPSVDDKQLDSLADILSDKSSPAGMYMKNSAWAEKAVEIKQLTQEIRGNSMDPFDSNTGFFNGVDSSIYTDDSLIKNQLRKKLAAVQTEIKRIPEFIPIDSTEDGQLNTEGLVNCGYLNNTTKGAIDFTDAKQTSKLESLGLIVYKND
jgi:hypothetical protein